MPLIFEAGEEKQLHFTNKCNIELPYVAPLEVTIISDVANILMLDPKTLKAKALGPTGGGEINLKVQVNPDTIKLVKCPFTVNLGHPDGLGESKAPTTPGV